MASSPKKLRRFLEGRVSTRRFKPGKEPVKIKRSMIGTASGPVASPRTLTEKGVLTTRDINRAQGDGNLRSALSKGLRGRGNLTGRDVKRISRRGRGK